MTKQKCYQASCILFVVYVLIFAVPALSYDQVPFMGINNGALTIEILPGFLISGKTVGTGYGTPIGPYNINAHEITDIFTGDVTDGGFALTDVNGDQIYGTYEGKFFFTGLTTYKYKVSGPITGGTGRFSKATGSLTFTGSGSFITMTLREIIIGTISY